MANEIVIPLNAVDRHVGARLRARRLFLQMSEEWFVDHFGISLDELTDLEEGRARISFEMQQKLCVLLDVADRYFYQGFGVKPNRPTPKTWLREVDHWFAAQIFPHERALLAVARKMTGNNETARDVVHDAYADVLSGDKWRVILNPRAYAMKAVRSLAGRILQRSRVVPFELLANMDTLDRPDDSPDAHQILSAKQKRQQILDAIEQLPPQCRKVVKLRRLKEMAPSDIARELGLNIKTVEMHLARGLVMVADAMNAGESGDSEKIVSNARAVRGE